MVDFEFPARINGWVDTGERRYPQVGETYAYWDDDEAYGSSLGKTVHHKVRGTFKCKEQREPSESRIVPYTIRWSYPAVERLAHDCGDR